MPGESVADKVARWPGPVWGHGSAQLYAPAALQAALRAAREALGLSG